MQRPLAISAGALAVGVSLALLLHSDAEEPIARTQQAAGEKMRVDYFPLARDVEVIGALGQPLGKVLAVEGTLFQPKPAGHQFRLARTGFQALQAAPKFAPQVVLLDIGLPDMDGWKLANEIRQTPGLTDPRIITVTAFQTSEDRQKSKEAGISER